MKVKMWADTLTHLIAFALGFLSNVLFDKYKRGRDRKEKLKEKTEKFKEDVTAKLNEFESIWIREEDKQSNTKRLKVESQRLGDQILEIVSRSPSNLPPATLETLKEIESELMGMGAFIFYMGDGTSHYAFLEKGNNILDMIKELETMDFSTPRRKIRCKR